MNKAEYTARNADLIAYLHANGYALEKSGHEHRLKQPDSITVRGNKWFRHSEGVGGGPLEFLTHVEGRNKDDAIRVLTGIQAYSAPSRKYPVPVAAYGKPKAFALPEAASRAPHVLAYLTKARGIDGDIVMRLLQQKLVYQSKDGAAYLFEVYEIEVVLPGDLSVFDETGYPSLTLLTCTPVRIASHRLIVRARLKGDL